MATTLDTLRTKIKGLPESQQDRYARSVFNVYVKKRLSPGLSLGDVDEARSQWVDTFLGRKPKPLSPTFGKTPTKGSILDPLSMGLLAMPQNVMSLAGAKGAAERYGRKLAPLEEKSQEYKSRHPYAGFAAEQVAPLVATAPVGMVGKVFPTATRLGSAIKGAIEAGASAPAFTGSWPGVAAITAGGGLLGGILGKAKARLPASAASVPSAPPVTPQAEVLGKQAIANLWPHINQTGKSLPDLIKEIPTGGGSQYIAEYNKLQQVAGAGTKFDRIIQRFTDKHGAPSPAQEALLRGTKSQQKQAFDEAEKAAALTKKAERIKATQLGQAMQAEAKKARAALGRPLTAGEVDRIKTGETAQSVIDKPEVPAVVKPAKSPAVPKAVAPTASPAQQVQEAGVPAQQVAELKKPLEAAQSVQQVAQVAQPAAPASAVASSNVPAFNGKLSVRLSEAEKALPETDRLKIAQDRLKEDTKVIFETIKKSGATEGEKTKQVSALLARYQKLQEHIVSGEPLPGRPKGAKTGAKPLERQLQDKRLKDAARIAEVRAKAMEPALSKAEVRAGESTVPSTEEIMLGNEDMVRQLNDAGEAGKEQLSALLSDPVYQRATPQEKNELLRYSLEQLREMMAD